MLVRADLNVPLADGVIGDDTRIRAAIPTVEALRARGARVILCSHLGRPKGAPRPELSLQPVCDRLGELLGDPVRFADDCIGPAAEEQAAQLAEGDVLLLENLRFHAEEEQDDPAFAAALAALADVYVNDAFGAAHRAHASTAGVAALLPAAAGYLLRRELEVLGELLDAPAHPFVVVSGGVKVADKIGVIERLAGPADAILIGGAMAYTFAVAQGGRVGSSLHEDEEGQESARRAIAACAAAGCELLLPVDSVCGRSFSADPPQQVFPSDEIDDGWMGLDIGPQAAATYAERVRERRDLLLERPDGRVRARAVRGGHDRDRPGGRGLHRHDRGRRWRLGRRADAGRPRGPGHARLHRRRCEPRAARGPHAAGRRRTAHGLRTRWTSAPR